MVNRRRPRNPGGANDTYVCQRNSQGNIYQRGRSGASYALNDVHEVVRLKQLGGRSEREIGGIVKRSQTFVRGVWRRHQRDGGVLLTLRHGGWRRGSVTTGHRAYLLGLLRKYPTKYHRYYRLKLNTHFGRTFSQGQVQRMLKAMGMTRKKITAMMIESLTPWARARQAAFLALIAALKANDPQVRRRLHFVDVSGVDQTTFNARYGMGPKGERVLVWQPSDRGTHHDLIASISYAGLESYLLVPGHVNMHNVATWFAQLLHQCNHGDALVLDNASYWASAGARAILAAVCAAHQAATGASIDIIYLPPRMPWYQPIEHIFGWLKEKLRAAPPQATMTPYATVYNILAGVTPVHCQHLIDHFYA